MLAHDHVVACSRSLWASMIGHCQCPALPMGGTILFGINFSALFNLLFYQSMSVAVLTIIPYMY